MADLRITRQVAEVVASDPPAARLLRTTCQVAEVVASDPSPERVLRVTRQAVEVMGSDPAPERKLRVTRQAAEVMASDPPPLPGLEVTRQGVELLGQSAPGLIVTRQGVEVLATLPDGTFVSAENSLGLSQAASHNTVGVRSAASTLSLAGTAAVNRTTECSASNTLTLSDAAGVKIVQFVGATNALSLGDQAAGELVKLAHSVLALSQQATQTVVRQVSANSALALDDAADASNAASRSASNALGLAGAAGVNMAFAVEATNTLSLAGQATAEIIRDAYSNLTLDQQAACFVVRHVSASSALTLNHAAGGVGSFMVSAENTLGFDVQAMRATVIVGEASSPLLLAQHAAANLSRPVSASNALALSDQATGLATSTIECSASNTLTLADQATVTMVRAIGAGNTLTLDGQAEGNLSRAVSASNALALTDSAIGLPVPTIEVSAESDLSLWHWAEGRNSSIYVESESELDLSGNAHGNKVAHVAATTPIYFTEITLDRLTFDEIEVEHGLFVSASVYIYGDPEPTGNMLSFGQRAGIVRVRADGISVTATSALTFSQWANPTPTGDATSHLTLEHFASATTSKVATSTLALGHQASFTIARFVSAGSTLSLHQAVNVVLVKGCVDRSYTPFVGSTDDPNAPAPPSTTVPTLERVEGVQLYWPVNVPTMTVTLRGPELDNKDRLRFQRINRETRGGTLIVFADPIWPKVQQLTLEFVGLEENEAQSLLTFIRATLGKEVGLRDWENRHWAGVIVSPDEPIIRNGPQNISTALEFEGVPA